jgi:hypothetical protein
VDGIHGSPANNVDVVEIPIVLAMTLLAVICGIPYFTWLGSDPTNDGTDGGAPL